MLRMSFDHFFQPKTYAKVALLQIAVREAVSCPEEAPGLSAWVSLRPSLRDKSHSFFNVRAPGVTARRRKVAEASSLCSVNFGHLRDSKRASCVSSPHTLARARN